MKKHFKERESALPTAIHSLLGSIIILGIVAVYIFLKFNKAFLIEFKGKLR